MEEKNMMVSIITPCYNSVKTIEQTLKSVAEQSYRNIEYIIIDGGSKDGTVEKIQKWKESVSFPVVLISESDHGIYDAMNKGIRIARGKLIGIVNSDDWYEPDTISNAVEHYSGAEYEVIYGMQRVYQDEKEREVVLYHHDFLNRQMITHPTCFVTKYTYEKFGCFAAQKYRSAADYDFMLRLFESKQVRFQPIYQILSNFRAGGMSSGQIGVRENAKIRYERRYISFFRCRYIILKSHLYELVHRSK